MSVFSYNKPDDHTAAMMEDLKVHAERLYDAIQSAGGDGRYTSLALTSLEQSVMWANKAMTR